MFVCGITPYDAAHLGHANTYLAFDLIGRLLRDNGHAVTYVQNVTDIDDPLLERANETSVDWQQLAHTEIQQFRNDMTALRMLAPTHYVGVVESMDLVISCIERLRDSGAAYEVDGDLYFDIRSDPRFGGVGHLSEATMLELSAERGGDPARPGKRHPLDPVLWIGQRRGEPGWDSPFGRGRPGWHVECVAIAIDRLGMSFDIQGGGSDLVFPHHELGSSEAHACTGEWPFARAYVHAGMVGLDGDKMSKSKGNLVFVSELVGKGADPMAVRLALLSQHYRQDWDWNDGLLVAGSRRLALWRQAASYPCGPDADKTLSEVRRALALDLNTATALTLLDAWASDQINRGGTVEGAPGVFSRTCDALLGVAL